METIHKYTLPINPHVAKVPIPAGARILTAQIQDSSASGEAAIAIWALVKDEQADELRTFRTYPTGYDMTPIPTRRLTYVATVQYHGTVLHVFEDKGE